MGEYQTGFRPAQRAVALADAVRREPAISRSRLAALLREHGEAARDVRGEAFTVADAAALRAAAGRLTAVLLLTDVDHAARALNALLAECATAPRLSNHDGHHWHLHVDRHDAGWAEWFLTSSALALAQLMSERGRIAWGECAAAGCATLFLGTGPGSPRRYCSKECATRARVAAHRARRTAAAGRLEAC
ncbi:MAG: CGNR zinc finger domain-containing protein [Streptosporangiales bacterium]|nr:CGNR zinc finger domain-containing protein [Streptosporangiales bacterium]